MSAQKPWLDRRGRTKKRPTIDQFADVLVAELARFYERNKARWDAIAQCPEDLSDEKRRRLISAFGRSPTNLTPPPLRS
jgi:hypothetical protein